MGDSSLVRSAGADGLFAGIDWGNSFHQLCLADPQGEIVHQARYDHDVAGLAELASQDFDVCLEFFGRVSGDEARVGLVRRPPGAVLRRGAG
ncbi:MAG: hypothetical protein ACLP52_27530 [Streptosporangiaceae bacterium]